MFILKANKVVYLAMQLPCSIFLGTVNPDHDQEVQWCFNQQQTLLISKGWCTVCRLNYMYRLLAHVGSLRYALYSTLESAMPSVQHYTA